jgi:methionine sulfoxide reductase heme-binding subunit
VTHRTRIVLKVLVWLGCLGPLATLLYWLGRDDLTANPISFVTNTLGEWTFRLLLASLAMTPLRIVTGLSWPVTLRRLLGLFAFFYASLHFLVWIVVDHFFDWPEMATDIVKRPYITVGMSALLALVPLAITSTTGMVKRLGGQRWRRLHRLAYVAGILASLHFVWLAKVGRTDPYVYVSVLVVLLGIRGGDALRRAIAKHRPPSATVSTSAVPRRVP